jgi:WD40 repeat protein
MRNVADGAAVGGPLPFGQPVFSPDGKFLLLCGVRPSLWEVATGKRVAELPGPLFSQGAAFSPDGATLLAATFKEARLWKTGTGEAIGKPLRHADVVAAAFTADGKTAWTTSLAESRAWDPATGKPRGEPLHHPPGVTRVTFGPGRRIVLLALGDRRFVALDLEARKPAYEPVEAPGAITSINRIFTEQVVAIGEEHAGVVWDAAADRPLAKDFPLSEYWPLSLNKLNRPDPLFAVCPDRASFFVQTDPRSLQVRDTAGKALGPPVREDADLLAAGFGPNGKTLWTESRSGNDSTRLFRLRRLAGGDVVLSRVVPAGWPHAFSSDGKTLVGGPESKEKSEIHFWSTATGAAEGEPLAVPEHVNLALFSPGGRHFIAATGATVRVWDLASRKRIGPLAHPWRVGGLGVCADRGGEVLLAWSGNKVQLWEMATGQPIGAPVEHSVPIASFVFSPDGAAILLRHPEPVHGVGGQPASVHTVLDRRTGKVLGRLPHPVGVSALSFRPDGQYLATLDFEGVMRLWGAGRWECLASSQPRKVLLDAVTHLSWGPEGRTVIAADSRGGRCVWHPPFPLEGPPEQVRRRLEVLTGQFLDDEGTPHALDAKAWEERRK